MIHNASPVETADDLPEFCTVCGRRMKRYREQTGYASASGKPLYRDRARCPAPFWSLINHDEAVVAPFPKHV